MTSKPENEGELVVDLVGEPLCACPFCDGDVSIAYEPPAVLHTLPVCSKYTALDAEDFLIAVRNALAGAKPS